MKSLKEFLLEKQEYTYEIAANKVEKETAKAKLINFDVTWNEGKIKEKSFWVPISVIKDEYYLPVNNGKPIFKIDTWFLDKLSKDNAWNGYKMRFENIFK